MIVIRATDVNSAYPEGLRLIQEHGVEGDSRAGRVKSLLVPLTVHYERPMQRVLFESGRDANPFFHLFESLWMLAGRNDAVWLDQFVHDFSERFSENGVLHGAYGYRWRRHFDLEGGGHPTLPDQLKLVVALLRANLLDRRAVISMWDPVADLGASKKDVPCNLCVVPRIVNHALDITVFCRSNDWIWGATGANVVHFSVLQEYLAACIGVGVGSYFQISTNSHFYTDLANKLLGSLPTELQTPYADFGVAPTPIVTVPEAFDEDLAHFMADPAAYWGTRKNTFFENVATPLYCANRAWKNKDRERALLELSNMPPRCDWRVAAEAWCQRRMAKSAP